jgi:hypothetical protein
VTSAASIPSAEVPDINPTTFIPWYPFATRTNSLGATLIELWCMVKESNGQGLTGC